MGAAYPTPATIGGSMMRAFLLVAAVLFSACSSNPIRLVYANDFSFANYDYLVVSKPGAASGSALYGLDVEFANVISRYNVNVIGDRQLADLAPEQRQRTLIARLAMEASDKHVTLTVSFDNAVTNKTVASATSSVKGYIFKPDDRDRAMADVSSTITTALQQEKGLRVQEISQSK